MKFGRIIFRVIILIKGLSDIEDVFFLEGLIFVDIFRELLKFLLLE